MGMDLILDVYFMHLTPTLESSLGSLKFFLGTPRAYCHESSIDGPCPLSFHTISGGAIIIAKCRYRPM